MRADGECGHFAACGIKTMQAYVDLHLHSCLSPCANDDMTPWNIVGMAKLKELDVIAVTDHNCALNLPEAMEAGKEYGVTVLPGLEITSKEEVHMLAYFETLPAALRFGKMIYQHLPDVKNDASLFGRQLIIGGEDCIQGEVEKLLIAATDFSVEALAHEIKKYGGVAIPAHINRGANGMIGALGLMPMLPEYPAVEVSPHIDCPAYATKGRRVLQSSDAHRLEDIQEREFTMELAEVSPAAIMAMLRDANA